MSEETMTVRYKRYLAALQRIRDDYGADADAIAEEALQDHNPQYMTILKEQYFAERDAIEKLGNRKGRESAESLITAAKAYLEESDHHHKTGVVSCARYRWGLFFTKPDECTCWVYPLEKALAVFISCSTKTPV